MGYKREQQKEKGKGSKMDYHSRTPSMRTEEEYEKCRKDIIDELAKLEKIGWANENNESSVFPYVIQEAINVLLNSRSKDETDLIDYMREGEVGSLVIDTLASSHEK